MKKEPTNLNGFRKKLIASNLQPFYKSISATAMMKYRNHLLPKNELYNLFGYIRQTTSKNTKPERELWREFWGILGKKINPATNTTLRLNIAPLSVQILILLKCRFNTFLSNELSFEKIQQAKNPLIPAIWHRVGYSHKTFWNNRYNTIPI